MDQDDLQDLKQFITTTIYQATSDLATKEDLATMKTEILGAVADTMTQTNDHIFNQLDNHQARIGKLEAA